MRARGASAIARRRPGDRDAVQRIERDHRAPAAASRARTRTARCGPMRAAARSHPTRAPRPAIRERHRVERRRAARARAGRRRRRRRASDRSPRRAASSGATRRVRGHAEHFVAPLRALRRVFERAGEAARFARRQVALVGLDQRDGEPGRDAEDDDDDEDLDEREAARASGAPTPMAPTGPMSRCRRPRRCRPAGRRRRTSRRRRRSCRPGFRY